jgi:hypothetical protein
MVCTCTGDFTQYVPEASNAHAGAAMNELRNAARGSSLPSPPPPTPTVREHRAAAGHAERAHEGADGEPRAV